MKAIEWFFFFFDWKSSPMTYMKVSGPSLFIQKGCNYFQDKQDV